MNLLLKILFFVLTIFQTNICEAKVVVFADVILETTFSNTLNSGKSNLKLKRVFSRNDLANTCKNDSGLVDYRKRGVSTARVATKGGIEAANGLKITGFTSHKVDRAIGSFGRSGVKPNAILDAIKNL